MARAASDVVRVRPRVSWNSTASRIRPSRSSALLLYSGSAASTAPSSVKASTDAAPAGSASGSPGSTTRLLKDAPPLAVGQAGQLPAGFRSDPCTTSSARTRGAAVRRRAQALYCRVVHRAQTGEAACTDWCS
ncbi:hypothetical protein [Streptomyces sp. NPDC010273]|uniref:hypothetical protein n=1 Tax=Streptomyces sp. NPDC010273 TaxID=3364829 RepID=UPI0036F0849E